MTEGFARAGFDADLAFGEMKEAELVEAIRGAHVECKADQKVRSTGNFFIEFRQGSTEKGQGRTSGLAESTAEWWALEYDDDRWLLIRKSLLAFIARENVRLRGSVMGGDGNRYEGVLIPIEQLLRSASVADAEAA